MDEPDNRVNVTVRALGWLWSLVPQYQLAELLHKASEPAPNKVVTPYTQDKDLIHYIETYLWRTLPGASRAREYFQKSLGDERFKWAESTGNLRTRGFLKTLALWGGRAPEDLDNRDAHTEHCCIEHGCKYGHEDCTVVTREKVQTMHCYVCDEEIRDLDD